MKKLAQELLDLKYEDIRTLSSFVADSIDDGPADALVIAGALLEFARLMLEDAEHDEQKSAAKPDNDGWIEWSGGLCPVDSDKRIDIRLRDGREFLNVSTLGWRWDHYGCTDIIAYRIRKQGDEE